MQRALYDELYHIEESYWWFRARRSIVLSLIRRYSHLREPAILDVGCGTGYNLLYLSRHYKDVRGLDSSDDALVYCGDRGVSALKGSLPDQIPFENGSFDVVLMMDVLEHIEDDQGALDAASLLVREQGLIIVTVPAFRFLWAPRDEFHHHKRRYRLLEMMKLLGRLPFERLVLSYYNSILSLPIVASRIMAKIRRAETEGTDIHLLPGPINSLFEKLFESEKHLLPIFPLPFGISIIAVYRKKQL